MHVVTEIHTGNSNSPTDDYVVYMQLPWCNERLEIRNDKEIIEVFDLFSKYYCKRIVFEVDHKPYRPIPPEGSSFTHVHPEVVVNDSDTISLSHSEDNENLLREYAIQEGVNLDRVKNDKNRLIFKCKGSLFWKASRSCTVYDFNRTMDAIKSTNKDARIWLDKIDPAYWSKHAFDSSVTCDHVTNNMTESFNSMLGEHRAKTYLCLLEHIRRIVMKNFQERKEQCASHYMQFSPLNDVVADFVHPSLTKTAFLRTYDSMIHPVPDLCMWPSISTTPVIPPPIKTLLGRPRVARRREADERPKGTRATSVVCRKCGLVGHNKRTCKGGIMSKVRELFYFVRFAPFCMFYL
ncbi:hypothetical protein ACOSP7_012524 [Xanthoceras sorbifolium]